MPRLLLFYRLMVRPLFREPLRAGLIVLAVALGVAVVLAIDLAGNAATGSFRSSMETLAGDNDLEIIASGGVPEDVVATLASLPYPIRTSPRLEDFAVIADTKKSLPLIGLDLVAEAGAFEENAAAGANVSQLQRTSPETFEHLGDSDAIWIGASFGRKPGDRLQLLINDRVREYTVRGLYPDSNGNESAIVMDIAAAQFALTRYARGGRILLKVPRTPGLEEWARRFRAVLPAGVDVRPQGAGTSENRRMLAAFRWNLRLLSYISLVVGAFLIYNTISVSVVRRRPEIGILRALGAGRLGVLSLFLGEALLLGLAGSFAGVLLGRILAQATVGLIADTVNSLYTSSRPARVELTLIAAIGGVAAGAIVALVSALAPAREAMSVTPVSAMGRGAHERQARLRWGRRLIWSALLAVAALLASQAPSVDGKPMWGYAAALLWVGSPASAAPA